MKEHLPQAAHENPELNDNPKRKKASNRMKL